MILYFNATTLDVTVSDESYRYQQIMGEHSLTLIFALPTYVEIPVGAYCEFQGETYTLLRPQNLKKQHSRNFEYTLIMEASQSLLSKYKFKDPLTRKLKFWLTAKPQEHLQMLIDNLNARDSGWLVGSYVDSPEKLISYNHNSCTEALKMMAETFNTEFEVVGKTISLRRVEYNKSTPLPLTYGKGNGLKPGVGRTNYDNNSAVEILYVQGGEKNINPSTYGSTELLLPKSQPLTYEGRAYVTDADGLYVKRSDKALQTNEEDSLDCSNIYPGRTGTVSSVVVVDAVKNFYDFIDSSLTFDYNQYLIAGETMTVIFQSGMLAGRELEVKYIDAPILNSQGVQLKAGKRFELVPQEIDGQTMPNDTFKPAIGDTYIAFGMTMPTEYVCDDVNKVGASWDMYREAVKYLYENEDPRFSFTGEMDGIYTKTNWSSIGTKIIIGGYILFSDAQFQITGVPIRIIGMKQPVNNPYKPQIELSNVTAGNTVSSMLRKIETSETVIYETAKQQATFTKRRYRDAKETIELLKLAQLHFTEAINPVAVETMSLLVGDVSLQFRFVDAKLSQNTVSHNVLWDNETKTLKVDGGWLQHMTLGIGSITKSHAAAEYKYWNLAYFESAVLQDVLVNGEMKSLAYYLYAHCIGDGGATANSGSFVLSSAALASAVDDYYFLVGVLNSEFEDDRSFVTLYGYTEVLPGRITADRVVSTDGLNFLDFVKKSFRVGSNDTFLEFNKDVWDAALQKYVGDGKLRLKGSLVQNAGGIEDTVGVFRGEYNSANTYYYADEVSYAGATYRYINATASGTIPTDTAYWIVKAAAGLNGKMERIYLSQATNTPPATPATSQTDGDVPAGWYSTPQTISLSVPYSFMCERTKSGTVWSAWSAPAIVARYSADGADGTDYEYIYTRTTTNTQPATPATSQVDDFIPTGWTDNATGVDATNIYEWVSERFKQAGTWSAFTTPALWAKFGLDGADGTDFEYIFQRTTTNAAPATPATSQVDDYVPAGWTDNPTGVDATNIYEWSCRRTKQAGVWSAFTNSALWAKYGETGATGATGNFTEIRYAKNTSETTPPTIVNTDVAPVGWTTNIPVAAAGEYVWMTSAVKTADGNTLVSNWSTPTRVTGEKGSAGADGAIGAALIFRGDYDAAVSYSGSSTVQQIVNYSSSSYLTKKTAGTFSGQLPTNTTYWEPFGGNYESIATKVLYAALAYVDNLGVRYLNTGGGASGTGQRVTINGAEGSLTFYDANNNPTMTLANGIAWLKNAQFISGSQSAGSAVQINSGIIELTETTTGEFTVALKTVDINAGGIDLYQMIGGGAKHIHIHSLAGTISIQGTEIVITNSSSVEIARIDLNGISTTSVSASGVVSADTYGVGASKSAAQEAALQNSTLFVNQNGVLTFKDANGASHILF
ncbi:MAG: hypothetical protein M1292_11535 [Bacteroidetes bacterium]|nr:hypothetical protein [Bacteroidota bacterium]